MGTTTDIVRLADVSDGGDDASLHTGDPGRLFLWFPVGLALRKTCGYLRRMDRAFSTTFTGALTIDASEGYAKDLLLDIADLLTDDEGADTRCVFKGGGGDLDVEDIRRVRTIHELRQLHLSSWLLDLLHADRLTSVFQPIVHAGATTRVLGHEALLRGIGHNGQTLSPGSLFDAARGCGMLPQLDCAARRSAIRVAGAHEEKRPLFLNVTPEAIGEGVRYLATTIHAIEAADIPRERIVFEVTEAGHATDVRKLKSIAAAVRHEGFRVALDDIGCAEHSRRLIHEVRPDFMKLDMQHVRGGRGRLADASDAERLLELAQTLKVETIAEGVETCEELEWNRARGATYVQGFYIARPGAFSA